MPLTLSTDFSELLIRARKGDTDSVGQLLEPHRRLLTAQAERILSRPMQRKVSVGDVVQECFEEAYLHLGQFRGGTEAEFLAWLRRILASRITAALKRYYFAGSRNLRLEQPIAADLPHEAAAWADPGTTPSQYAVRNERRERLDAALAQLPPDYAAVIRLRELEGLKFEQVARVLEQTVAAIKGKHLRALLHLGRLLEGRL